MTTMLTYNLGVQAFDERDYGTAIERFTEVLAAEPGNVGVREYLARAYFHRAALAPAERECRAILETDPTNEYITLLLARALERQNRPEEALTVRRLLAALTGDDRHLAGHEALA